MSEIVTTNEELINLCKQIDKSNRFAIDLEFIPERTYEPVVCLIQVATDNLVQIIDPIASIDLVPLWERVADPYILKVLHAGNQDLELIYKMSGLLPKNIFDTQIAAGFAGLGYQVGYRNLLNQMLKLSIAKTESYTDWLLRPLTSSQIEYALEDVRHLLSLYDKLSETLKKSGRFEWVKEECKRYELSARYEKNRRNQAFRIKGAGTLTKQGLAILQSLCEWRDKEAQKINKPVRAVMSDNILLELSRKPPDKLVDIERIRGIRSDQVKVHGQALLKSIQLGVSSLDNGVPIWPQLKIPAKQEILLADVIFLILKIIAQEVNLAVELIATRDEIQSFVRLYKEGKLEVTDHPLMKGWRLELAGKYLSDLISGTKLEMTIHAKDERPVTINIMRR